MSVVGDSQSGGAAMFYVSITQSRKNACPLQLQDEKEAAVTSLNRLEDCRTKIYIYIFKIKKFQVGNVHP